MNLLDRYIFKSILVTSLGAVALFAMVLTLGSVMKELMSFLLAGQIDLLFFLRLTALTLIYVCGFAMPMGVLTAVLLTLGRLSADSEVTAMRASGMSLLRIARPVIVLGLLLACCSFCITSILGPWARATYKRELNEAIRANPLSVLVPRTFVRTFPGFVVYVGDKTGPDIRELCLWQLDPNQRVIRMIRARTAKVDYDENANDLILNLGDAIVELRDPKAPESSVKPQWVGSFGESEQIRLSLNQLFSRANAVRTKLDFLPWEELVAQRDKLALPVQGETPQQRYDRERGHAKVGIVLSERVNNALVVLTFALVAVPLGIKVSRRETSANLGLAVAIALGYFVLFTAIGWLEKMPQTMPWLLLYVPNLLLLGMTWWLYARVERR